VTVRNVVLQEFVSLDGLAAGPGDSVDFIPASTQGDEAFGREQMSLVERVDTLLLGRATYEMFAGFWPHVTDGPDKGFADRFNALRRIVFSTTLERAPWGSWDEGTIVSGDVAREVAALKEGPGADVLVSGSISLAQALIDAGLIDEYRLVLCPIVLGSGRRLFGDDATATMTIESATRLDRGGVSLVYRPTR